VTDEPASSIADLLERDHRRLDYLFGGFLAAVSSGDVAAAVRTIEEFDAALRRHTGLEEEHLFPLAPGESLSATPDESARGRLFRELRLEHVQIRELSGMILRLLGDRSDPAAARGLATNLARRWDAHTLREEREAYSLLRHSLDAAGEAAIREALRAES
jgi:hypothetical protein